MEIQYTRFNHKRKKDKKHTIPSAEHSWNTQSNPADFVFKIKIRGIDSPDKWRKWNIISVIIRFYQMNQSECFDGWNDSRSHQNDVENLNRFIHIPNSHPHWKSFYHTLNKWVFNVHHEEALEIWFLFICYYSNESVRVWSTIHHECEHDYKTPSFVFTHQITLRWTLYRVTSIWQMVLYTSRSLFLICLCCASFYHRWKKKSVAFPDLHMQTFEFTRWFYCTFLHTNLRMHTFSHHKSDSTFNKCIFSHFSFWFIVMK